MEEEPTTYLRRLALPLGVGIATYLAARKLSPIPKDWSISPRLGGRDLVGGFVEGLGNVRNLAAAGLGAATAIATHELVASPVSNGPDPDHGDSAGHPGAFTGRIEGQRSPSTTGRARS